MVFDLEWSDFAKKSEKNPQCHDLCNEMQEDIPFFRIYPFCNMQMLLLFSRYEMIYIVPYLKFIFLSLTFFAELYLGLPVGPLLGEFQYVG